MEKVYRAFKGRQAQRRKAFASWLALLAFFIVFGVIIYSNLKWFFGAWFFVAFLATTLYFFYIITRSWASETIERSIFVDLYDASRKLELCSEKDREPQFYSTKAKDHVEKAINRLSNLCYRKPLSNLFEREFVEPLERLEENLETIILPRITQQRDIEKMIRLLRSVAVPFSEVLKPISLEDITNMNEQIEQYRTRGVTVAIESKLAPKETVMRKIRESTIGRGIGCLALGYGLVLLICGLYVFGTRQDFMTFARERPDIVILGGLLASGITFWKTR